MSNHVISLMKIQIGASVLGVMAGLLAVDMAWADADLGRVALTGEDRHVVVFRRSLEDRKTDVVEARSKAKEVVLPDISPSGERVIQQGSTNRLDLHDNPPGHQFSLRQEGGGNNIDLLRTGSEHTANVEQLGEDNSAQLSQHGLTNNAGIKQRGQGNVSSVVQNGQQNSVSVSQVGNRLGVSVQQDGEFGRAFVEQTQ